METWEDTYKEEDNTYSEKEPDVTRPEVHTATS